MLHFAILYTFLRQESCFRRGNAEVLTKDFATSFYQPPNTNANFRAYVIFFVNNTDYLRVGQTEFSHQDVKRQRQQLIIKL